MVTTSWDDGDPKDLRISELLSSRGLRGTFYIPIIGYDGRPTLDAAGLKTLVARGLEIGSHGLSHHTLPKFCGKELIREVRICKHRLQDMLGEEVRMFAYPKGRYNANVIRHVKEAGYVGARTNAMAAYKLNFSRFEMPTTVRAYPSLRADYLRNLARACSPTRALEWMVRFARVTDWVEMSKRFFDLVLQQGGMWHLLGHSWEIEEMGLWNGLAEVFDYVAGRKGVFYLNNVEVLDLLEHRPPGLVLEERRTSAR